MPPVAMREALARMAPGRSRGRRAQHGCVRRAPDFEGECDLDIPCIRRVLSVFRAIRHRLALRRAIATLVACTVLGTVAEPAIAEAHDGDAPGVAAASAATRTEVERGVTATARPSAPRASVSEPGALSPATSPAASWASGTAPDSSSLPSAPKPGSHGAHVCHCAHVHGGAPVVRAALALPSDRATTARPHSDRLPPSVAAEPHLRPPLSQSAA